MAAQVREPTDAEIGEVVEAMNLLDELTDAEAADAVYAVRPDLYEEAVAEAHIELMRTVNPYM